jgi:hypothetical protein
MLYSCDGKVIETRAELPAKGRNVHLKDGRILRYMGDYHQVNAQVYDCSDGLRVLCSLDETQFGFLLHVSASYPDKDPSWQDIIEIRYAFFSGKIDCMMVLPKREDYVNLHQHCFHIWQTPTQWGNL